jgi:hypothetical protein
MKLFMRYITKFLLLDQPEQHLEQYDEDNDPKDGRPRSISYKRPR